ncbi:MAG: hypothetical protein LBI61_03960 [Puniceicoccales bacterium]|jgi:hypothetical protein|nr:hypothetical protein [Puniceicoccales bacterium]
MNIKAIHMASLSGKNPSRKIDGRAIISSAGTPGQVKAPKAAEARSIVPAKPQQIFTAPEQLLQETKPLACRLATAPITPKSTAAKSDKSNILPLNPIAKLPGKAPLSNPPQTPATPNDKRKPSDAEITNRLLSIKNPKLSISAPEHGKDFYFEQQRNGSICGLCAARNYVGAPCVSLKTLNNIKRNHFAGKAVLATACDHINNALAILMPQMKKIVTEGKLSKAPKNSMELLAELSRLATATVQDGEKVIDAINAVLPALNAAGLGQSKAYASMQKQIYRIRSDCLDVSVGGSDPAFVLEALRQVDPNVVSEPYYKLPNGGNIFETLDAKHANRGIVSIRGHFVTVRKDGRGQWYILDSLRSSPTPIAKGSNALRGYSGVIYSTEDSIDPVLVDKLIAAMNEASSAF